MEDLGRGCPVDWNEKEQRYNWELIFCEMYAGGKYNNNEGENYEYSLGLNGLGACATQYASEYMDVTIWRDGIQVHACIFEQGEIVGGLESEPADRKKTGTTIRWRPDLEVFTDIDVPESYFQDVLQPAGRRERGRDVSPARAARQHVRDDGLLLRRRHPRLCQGACGRGCADCSGRTWRPSAAAATVRISPNTR